MEISGDGYTDQTTMDAIDKFFFNVTDPTVISPAAQGLGYDPQPSPGKPSLANPFGWWGSTMHFNASYLDPIALENLSFFNRMSAKATQVETPVGSDYSSWVEFTIPWDARSSIPATLQAHGRMSPGGSAVVLSPGLAYANIRGVVWAPQNGRVWVAADNLVAEVDLFVATPTSTPKVTDLVKPYISRVSSNGTFVVVDGAQPGVTTIFQVNVSDGSPTPFASTKDDGFTRDIQPVGIALSPDGLVCYVADALSGKVVRIPAGAGPGSSTIVDAWGGKTDFTFADPAAIDVNVGFQVLAGNNSDGYVWKLLDAVTRQRGSFVGAGIHSLEVDREISVSDVARFSYSSEAGAAEAFNLNPIGLNPPAYHGSAVYGRMGHLELYPQDRDWQAYTILPRDPQRVIISNSVAEVPYTSPLQEADRIIRFTVTGYPDTELHLKLIDPPDTAAYAPDGGWPLGAWPLTGRTKSLPYEGNDNADDPANPDVGLALSPSPTSWEKELNVTPGQDKAATVYLKVTNRYAGDNYQVEVMKCVPSGCGQSPFPGALTQRIVALSPIFTAWKRIFIERDMMFRKGGVLSRNYGATGHCGGAGQPNCCGAGDELPCNQIEVYSWANIGQDDNIHVFDEVQTFEKSSPDVRRVLSKGPDANGVQILTLDSPFSRSYFAAQITATTPYQPTFAPGSDGKRHGAGLGVTEGCDIDANQINSPTSCFYQADLRGMEAAYNDAFVEVFAPRSGMNAMPYIGEEWFNLFSASWELNLSQTWFANMLPTPPIPPPPHNYLHAIGASSQWKTVPLGRQWTLGGSWLDWDTTYLFRGSAEAVAYTDLTKDRLCQHTAVHEFGHQFNVNGCTPPDNHDTRPAWCEVTGYCGPGALVPQQCVMDSSAPKPDRWDPVNRFCVDDLSLGDENCQSPGQDRTKTAIRTQVDPS